jgi:protocatechuate 3,4-dioxygenase beta subunit
MGPTFRIVASLVVACAVGVVGTPSAAQATQTLTVTPDTGLADGDVVTLQGTGFTASASVGYCQGVFDEAPDVSDCDSFPNLGRIGLSPVNTAGEFSAQYIVRRFISVSGIGTVDCAQPSANCAISASNVSGTSAVGPPVVTPISFAPQPPLSLTVTPDTGLVDGDLVLVEGTGFLPEHGVQLCQEAAEQVSSVCPTESESIVTDDAGAFSVQYTVQRFVTPFRAGVTTDCAAVSATCAVSALPTFGPSVVTTIDFAPQPPVTVAAFGTVTGPAGEPLAGVQVWAYTPSDAWVGSLQTVTDAQGSYEFEEFELGVPYRIFFRNPSGSTLVSQWFDQALTRQSATVITLSSGEFVQANAQLGEASSISGSVTDTNGNPVAGVAVWAFGPEDTWVGSHVTSTGSDGTYLIANVDPGREYQVRFVPPADSGLAVEWWDDAPNRRSAESFVVVSPEEPTTGIDAQLEETGAISGSVTDTTGNPVSGVRVSAYGPDDGWVGSYAVSTASDGTYLMGSVRPGDYRVVFAPPADSGFTPEWFDDVASRSLATDVTVSAGQTVAGIDAQLADIP